VIGHNINGGTKEVDYKDAEEYLWRQMENGNIEDDYQQSIYEKSIEALRKVQELNL
jgi:hypothetical protein